MIPTEGKDFSLTDVQTFGSPTITRAFSESNYPEFLPENFLGGGESEMRPAFMVCFTISAKKAKVRSLMLLFFA